MSSAGTLITTFNFDLSLLFEPEECDSSLANCIEGMQELGKLSDHVTQLECLLLI